jgi:lauroyl/myristoyl acyltransferase
MEHLEGALGLGRGLLLISVHFGFFRVASAVLENLGIDWTAVGRPQPVANRLPVTADVWTRVRALHQIRMALARNHVAIILVDGRLGERIRVPFLRGQASIALGAFALAQRVGCPLVPFFVVAPHRPPRLRVDFCPPLRIPAGVEALTGAVREFVRVWETYAHEYPIYLNPRRIT